MARDTSCITQIDENHFEIRLRLKSKLTGKRETVKRRVHGDIDEAIAERDRLRVQLRDGRVAQNATRSTKTPMRSWLESYLRWMGTRRSRPASALTLKNHTRALKNHILPHIGDWLPGEIRRADLEWVVDDWCNDERDYSPSSINTYLKVMRTFMRHVYQVTELGPSPCESIEPLATPKSKAKKQHTVLTLAEMSTLLETMRAPTPQQIERAKDEYDFDATRLAFYYPMVLLGAVFGLRISEITALHWEDVDYDREVIRVHHSQVEGRRREGTKTGNKKTFPLLPVLREALDEHRRQLIASEHPGVGTGIVFPARVNPETAAHNGYMQRWTMADVLTEACTIAEVPRITAHDLRAFCDTHLMAGGLHPEHVRAITGHRTASMTYHYSHVSPADKGRFLSPIVTAISRPNGPNEWPNGQEKENAE